MKYFVVNAFADAPFSGNPAGVCLPVGELDDGIMQCIAAENNLSETAFIQRRDEGYGLRWFTPKVEIGLCGHATLASAFVLMEFVDPGMNAVGFETKSGPLGVKRVGDLLELDLPARRPRKVGVTWQMEEAVGTSILEAHAFLGDILLLLENEDDVAQLAPNQKLIGQLAPHGVIVTARGRAVDFVSRFFAPNVGVPEDPVTGSAHTILTPFWAERFGRNELTARQLSQRGGLLYCRDCGDRAPIAGKAVLYLQGEIAF